MTNLLRLAVIAAFSIAGAASCADSQPATSPAPKVRIVLVGDSTVTDKSGWGVGFKSMLTGKIECINAAQGGRSSKSFRDEGHWDKAVSIKADYMLIQFGHNDQPGKGAERETDPNTTFRENMKRYVTEARSAGMKPVLVTSLTRRNLDAAGKVKPDHLVNYAAATRAVAAEMNVPLIDLHARSVEICNALGKPGCEAISPPPKDGKPDVTHLNEKGSEMFGRIVAQELGAAVPELAPNIKAEKP